MNVTCQRHREDSSVVRTLTPGYTSSVLLKDWVKAERERRGWTQEQLAERAGIDRVEVNALERGRNKGTSTRIRDGLARAFEIHPAEVGGGERPAEEHRDAEPDLPRWRNLPWWDGVVAAARSLPRFRDTPLYAFERLGNAMGAEPPPPDPVAIGTMATIWHERATDMQRSQAIIDQAKREMAEEDAAHEAEARAGRTSDTTLSAPSEAAKKAKK